MYSKMMEEDSSGNNKMSSSSTGDGNRVMLSTLVAKRFHALTASPSKETIQSLARWVLFHRDNTSIVPSLVELFTTDQEDTSTSSHQSQVGIPRKLVFLYVIHELLLIDSAKSPGGGDEIMWEKYSDFRATVGESVLLPVIESIRLEFLKNLKKPDTMNSSNIAIAQADTICERFKTMRDMWKDVDSFNSPTLTDDISRAITRLEKDIYMANVGDANKTSSPQLADVDSIQEENHETLDTHSNTFGSDLDITNDDISCGTAIDESMDEGIDSLDVTVNITDMEEHDSERIEPTTLPRKRKSEFNDEVAISPEASPSHPTIIDRDDSVVDDWDTRTITPGKVQIYELDVPCKSIATMQITRDLHGESMTRLSTLVSTVPPSIFEACQAILDSNTVSADVLNSADFQAIPDEILDADLDGALGSLRLYKDIVLKQKEARKKCIELLIKSQCELGFSCKEAAQVFYTIDSKLVFLNKKKEKIRDAMELEGLDFEGLQNDNEHDREEEISTEFSWYKKEDMVI